MDVVERIATLFAARGDNAYHGEKVSQTEHALQAAWAGEKDGASDALIAAALLHDIGHLLHDLGEDAAERGIDDRHENGGAHWLARYFGPEVVEPVRLHVAAKRYLCAVDASYRAELSPASELSLQLQGGPMSESEVAHFAAGTYAQDAVALRRWDDQAKIENLQTPPLEHFLESVTRVARRAGD